MPSAAAAGADAAGVQGADDAAQAGDAVRPQASTTGAKAWKFSAPVRLSAAPPPPVRLSATEPLRLHSFTPRETCVPASFPGGAIDHRLVAGPAADGSSQATTPDVEGDEFAGSDHRPAVAVLAAPSAEQRAARARMLVEAIRSRPQELESILTPWTSPRPLPLRER